MSRASAIRLLLRRDRSDLAAVGLVMVLVAFTAFASSAGLRLFERAADEGLRREVAAAPVVQRTIQLGVTRSLFAEDATQSVEVWRDEGEQMRSTFPESLRALTGEANLAMGSVRLAVPDPPAYPLFITLGYQDGFQDLVELTAGRWPASTNEQLPPIVEFRETSGGNRFPVGTGEEHFFDPPRVFEIAVQEATAQQVGLEVGSRVSVAVDLLDPTLSTSVIRQADLILAPTELEVTGLYRLRDANADGWFGEPRLRIDDLGNTGTNADVLIAYISAYVAPEAVPGLVTSGLPFEYRWRFPLRIDRLDADAVDSLSDGLLALEATLASSEQTADVRADVGLLPLLERHTALRSASQSVLALAASAPLALAAGAVAMAAVLLARRRRLALILARGRGASSRVLFVAALLEALVVTVVGAGIGLGLAVAVVPDAQLEPALIPAIGVAVLAVVVLVGAALPQIRQPLGELERSARPVRRPSPRRLVAEVTIAVFAIVGAYLLRQRGVGTPTGGFDPFLAAVPPLIGLAAGIAAVRLYPPLMAVAGSVAVRRRGLVPALGVRTIVRGAASSLPALVLILAVGFATFTSVVSSSIDRAQRTQSWLAVGADVRIDPTPPARELPPNLDPASIPGVEASARGFVDSGIRAPAGTGVGTLSLEAIDAAAYSDVVAGAPIAPQWPSALVAEVGDGEAQAAGAVPAVIGTRLTGGEMALGAGDVFDITIFSRRVQLEVVEVRTAVGGLTTSDSFAIVPYDRFEQALGRDVRPTVMWLRVPEASVPAVQDAVRSEPGVFGGGVDVASRYDRYAALRDQPVVGAVGAGFLAAFTISGVYAVLTILGAVILSAGRRTRDVAILRTLGLDGSQQTRLTLLEHVPPILLALPVGVALGIGVAVAVGPALGLAALSGSSGQVPLVVDWFALGTLAGVIGALALIAVVVGSWLARRESIANALRIAEE